MAFKNEQLCWTCQNARADKCCWMQDLTPVEGWDADWVDEAVFKSGHVRPATYHIRKCPNYVQDEVLEPVKTGRPGTCTDRLMKLFEAIEKIAEKEQKIKLKLKRRN